MWCKPISKHQTALARPAKEVKQQVENNECLLESLEGIDQGLIYCFIWDQH